MQMGAMLLHPIGGIGGIGGMPQFADTAAVEPISIAATRRTFLNAASIGWQPHPTTLHRKGDRPMRTEGFCAVGAA